MGVVGRSSLVFFLKKRQKTSLRWFDSHERDISLFLLGHEQKGRKCYAFTLLFLLVTLRGVSFITWTVQVVTISHTSKSQATFSIPTKECLYTLSLGSQLGLQTKITSWSWWFLCKTYAVIPRGIEPRFPGWKPDVLTVRRWDQMVSGFLLFLHIPLSGFLKT